MKADTPVSCQLRVRFTRGSDIALGPGKVDLLEAIDRHGSISKAAASMHMSYRRAWLLVNTMNRCFKSPLVETRRGGDEKGGTRLSAQGQSVLGHYRDLEAAMRSAGEKNMEAILDLIVAPDTD